MNSYTTPAFFRQPLGYQGSDSRFFPLPAVLEQTPPTLAATTLPAALLPTRPAPVPEPPAHPFTSYASKLGYPETLIARTIRDLGEDAATDELLEHLVSLQDMLTPKSSVHHYRRDASQLPSYMLSQDSNYRGKERMPFWVWVKRETITADVVSDPPHCRVGARSRSRSTSGASTADKSNQ